MKIALDFTLKSEQLCLRVPSEQDIPRIFSATRVKGFNDGMLWEPPEDTSPMYESLARNLEVWQAGTAFGFAIDRLSDGQFVGRISIRPTEEQHVWNIGFWTHPDAQGQGIMTEAVALVLAFGFDQLKAVRIEACYALWNKASERVLQKNGFTFQRYIEQGFMKQGEWVEENLLAITKEKWITK